MQEELSPKIRTFYSPESAEWPEYDAWFKTNEHLYEVLGLHTHRYSQNVYQLDVYYKEKENVNN